MILQILTFLDMQNEISVFDTFRMVKQEIESMGQDIGIKIKNDIAPRKITKQNFQT